MSQAHLSRRPSYSFFHLLQWTFQAVRFVLAFRDMGIQGQAPPAHFDCARSRPIGILSTSRREQEMINRFYSWPIRVHLTILIVLLAVPSISLIVYSGITERREAITDAKTECLNFVNDVAGQHKAVVAGAEQLAAALALLPPIQSRNPAAASALFSELLKKNPQYNNILVCDKSGLVWASAIPLEGKVSLADRDYIQEAARTGMFSSGEYAIGRISKKPSMGFGYPVKNTGNELIAVIGVILNVNVIQEMFEKLNLPSRSSFSLLDSRGVIIIRNLKDAFSQKLVGRRDIREELFTKMTGGPDEGTYEAMGNDGNFRLTAYKKISLPHGSRPYLYIRSSIPLASAISKANAAMLRNLSVFVTLLLIGLFLAWFIGKRVIVNPIRMLKGASEQLAAGADTVHVSHAVKGGELGELARTFDAMAEALVQRETALRESEKRFRSVLDNSLDVIYRLNVQTGRYEYISPASERVTGFSADELMGQDVKTALAMIHPEDLPAVLAAHARLEENGQAEVEYRQQTKGGDYRWLSNRLSLSRDSTGRPEYRSGNLRDITERRQAERALQESEERFRRYFELGLIGMAVTSPAKGIIEVNDELCKMLGHEGGELLQKTWAELTHPEDLAADIAQFDRAMAGEIDGYTIDKRFIRKDGQVIDSTIAVRALRRPDGSVDYFVALVQDITERKRAEEESRRLLISVQEEKDRLSALINSIQDEVWFADAEKRLTLVNPAVFKEFGSKSLRGEKVETIAGSFEVFRPDGTVRPPLEAPPLRALRGEVLESQEEIVRSPGTGELRYRQVSAAPVRDAGGNIIGSVSVVRDITERKRMEEELRRARDELELRVQERTAELRQQAELIELSHDAIFVRDMEDRIIFWSRGAEEVYGWRKEEVLGKIPHVLLKTQFPVPLADLSAEFLAKGRWEGELVHTCQEGRKLDILSRWALQRDNDGRPSAILEINIDVTDRKRMEEQVRQAQRMEALGTLAGGIAHDFNNLLNPILLNTELALLDVESMVLPSAESLRLTREAVSRGKELVKQIIVFSRHKGQARNPIEISSVINEALKLLKSTALKAVEIRTQMEAGNIVLADPVQIHQVMMNLCLNAVHAMREKDGILEISLAKVEKYQDEDAARLMGLSPGPYVQLTVKDNGHGMSRETLERAFDPFFTTKQKGEGSGMGLAVVHGIVKKHEGAIRLESEEGKGTAVNIFLPVFQGDKIESVSSAPGEVPKGKERILFVDDEEAQIRTVQPLLERLGYSVTVEMDPRRALDRFRSHPDAFDLVITDQVMPYLPGNRLAQEMLGLRPDLPIILCTGFSETVDEDKARVMGIREFILKPFRLMEISELIRKVLDENRAK